jgi:surface polysaccharide O-acyltransferase-like enzyme
VVGQQSAVKAPRNYGIDAFRLLSALPVIAAHGGELERFDPSTRDIISLLSKWSVPFFFLVLGFFLGKKDDKQRATPPMLRITVMFLLACLLMLPLDLMLDGPTKTLQNLSKMFLIYGTHYHLWFLSSLIVGLLVIRVTDEYEVNWLMPLCAIGALLGSIVFSTYSPPAYAHLGRHLTSIPFLWFGILLSRRALSLGQSFALIAIGLAIQCAEVPMIHAISGKVLSDCPVLIGTAPFALGMFGVASRVTNNPLIEVLGRLGGRYTGCIYVTHVYFILLLSVIAQHLGIQNERAYYLLLVPLLFLTNLGALTLINRFAPGVIDIFLGDKATISRLTYSASR